MSRSIRLIAHSRHVFQHLSWTNSGDHEHAENHGACSNRQQIAPSLRLQSPSTHLRLAFKRIHIADLQRNRAPISSASRPSPKDATPVRFNSSKKAGAARYGRSANAVFRTERASRKRSAPSLQGSAFHHRPMNHRAGFSLTLPASKDVDIEALGSTNAGS